MCRDRGEVEVDPDTIRQGQRGDLALRRISVHSIFDDSKQMRQYLLRMIRKGGKVLPLTA